MDQVLLQNDIQDLQLLPNSTTSMVKTFKQQKSTLLTRTAVSNSTELNLANATLRIGNHIVSVQLAKSAAKS